jgi:hypothetical protein
MRISAGRAPVFVSAMTNWRNALSLMARRIWRRSSGLMVRSRALIGGLTSPASGFSRRRARRMNQLTAALTHVIARLRVVSFQTILRFVSG